MDRWEYLYVYVDDQGRVMKVNDENALPYGYKEPIHEFMNRVGAEGWRLNSHTTWSGPTGASHYFCFERQLDEDTIEKDETGE
jgi:hypothetical protein